jgi:hypothetical protein
MAGIFAFVWFNVRQHNNGYIDVSFWEKKTAQALRIANEIKRVYTSCIFTQKIRHHYNATSDLLQMIILRDSRLCSPAGHFLILRMASELFPKTIGQANNQTNVYDITMHDVRIVM